MNYLPSCGFWFYGAANAKEMASYFCSYGLLRVAPVYIPPTPTPSVADEVWTFLSSVCKKITGVWKTMTEVNIDMATDWMEL